MTMKAIQYEEFGKDYDKLLRLVDVEKPQVTPGCAVIKVMAASGNPIDFKVMQGGLEGMWETPMPMTVGYDFAGVVDAVEESDSSDVAPQFKPGDEVFAVNWGDHKHNHDNDRKGAVVGGAFAEYIRVPVHMLSKKPREVSFEQAAAVALVGTTAYQALFDCLKVESGQTVLILGGPTAVGSLAIQLAKSKGAWVAATASTRNLDYVKGFQPDLVVDYREKDWAKDYPELQGIDAVFDAVGDKDAFARASGPDSKVLKEGGSFVSIASLDAGFDPAAHQPRLTFGSFYVLSNSSEVQDELAKMISEGTLTVAIDKTFQGLTLDNAKELLKYIESSKSRGKNVITM